MTNKASLKCGCHRHSLRCPFAVAAGESSSATIDPVFAAAAAPTHEVFTCSFLSMNNQLTRIPNESNSWVIIVPSQPLFVAKNFYRNIYIYLTLNSSSPILGRRFQKNLFLLFQPVFKKNCSCFFNPCFNPKPSSFSQFFFNGRTCFFPVFV